MQCANRRLGYGGISARSPGDDLMRAVASVRLAKPPSVRRELAHAR